MQNSSSSRTSVASVKVEEVVRISYSLCRSWWRKQGSSASQFTSASLTSHPHQTFHHSCFTRTLGGYYQWLWEDFIWVSVTSGVRQGCVLALTPFYLYFDVAIRMALGNGQLKSRGVKVAYLHDVCWWETAGSYSMKPQSLIWSMLMIWPWWLSHGVISKSMLDDVSIRCRDLGLAISCSKTKTLAVLPSDLYPKPVLINLVPNDDPVEVMCNFEHLGSFVQDNYGTVIEVYSRICKASKAFRSLCRILWYQRKLKTCTKLRSFNAVVLPTLLWLGEFVLHEPQLHRLQGFVMRCLRIILAVSIRERKRHTTIRMMAKQRRLSSVLAHVTPKVK